MLSHFKVPDPLHLSPCMAYFHRLGLGLLFLKIKKKERDLCLRICVCTHACARVCPWRTEEGVGSPGTVVTSGCEPPHMGVGSRNQIWVLCKSSVLNC